MQKKKKLSKYTFTKGDAYIFYIFKKCKIK